MEMKTKKSGKIRLKPITFDVTAERAGLVRNLATSAETQSRLLHVEKFAVSCLKSVGISDVLIVAYPQTGVAGVAYLDKNSYRLNARATALTADYQMEILRWCGLIAEHSQNSDKRLAEFCLREVAWSAFMERRLTRRRARDAAFAFRDVYTRDDTSEKLFAAAFAVWLMAMMEHDNDAEISLKSQSIIDNISTILVCIPAIIFNFMAWLRRDPEIDISNLPPDGDDGDGGSGFRI